MLQSAKGIVLLNTDEHFITFCRNKLGKILLYTSIIFSSYFENHECSYYQEFFSLHLFSAF